MPSTDFVGVWKIIASSSPQHYMKIERHAGSDEQLDLSHGESEEGPWKIQQTLQYKADTGTLERVVDVGAQERCVVFWDRKNRNGALKNSIFAMRIQMPDESSADRFPWEAAGDNGTWGAEGG